MPGPSSFVRCLPSWSAAPVSRGSSQCDHRDLEQRPDRRSDQQPENAQTGDVRPRRRRIAPRANDAPPLHRVSHSLRMTHLNTARQCWGKMRHRTSAYLNSRIERDHRGIKRRVRCVRGFNRMRKNRERRRVSVAFQGRSSRRCGGFWGVCCPAQRTSWHRADSGYRYAATPSSFGMRIRL